MKTVIAILLLFLVGCSLPCTYHGKAVSKADAQHMQDLGMDVVCPE